MTIWLIHVWKSYDNAHLNNIDTQIIYAHCLSQFRTMMHEFQFAYIFFLRHKYKYKLINGALIFSFSVVSNTKPVYQRYRGKNKMICIVLSLVAITIEWTWLNQGWGLLSRYLPFRYFPNISTSQNTCKLFNIILIFGRCCGSSAVVTPVKYECD